MHESNKDIPCKFAEHPAGGFFCHCGQGSRGLPEPPSCWKCFLLDPPGRPDLSVEKAPPKSERPGEFDGTACKFRGEQLRIVNCQLCGGRNEPHEVFACRHALTLPECTISIRGRDNAATVAVCLGCDHRQQ